MSFGSARTMQAKTSPGRSSSTNSLPNRKKNNDFALANSCGGHSRGFSGWIRERQSAAHPCGQRRFYVEQRSNSHVRGPHVGSVDSRGPASSHTRRAQLGVCRSRNRGQAVESANRGSGQQEFHEDVSSRRQAAQRLPGMRYDNNWSGGG